MSSYSRATGALMLFFGLLCAFMRTPLVEFYPAVRFTLGAGFVLAGLPLAVRGCANHLFLKFLVWTNFFIWALAILGDPEAPSPYEDTLPFEDRCFWLGAVGVFTVVTLILTSKVAARKGREVLTSEPSP